MLRYASAILILFSSILTAAESPEALSAWRILNTPPRGDTDVSMSKEGRDAVEILRKHKAATARLVIAALSKGGSQDAAATYGAIVLEPEEQLRIARIIVGTYGPGDKSVPFLGFLASHGERHDMEIFRKIVQRDPNSEAAVQTTATMAGLDNVYAHAALLEWRNTIPGKWQESYYLKRFFARHDAEKSPPASGISSSVIQHAQTATPNSTTASETGAYPRPTFVGEQSSGIGLVSNSWRFWIGGAIVAAAAALLILRRQK